MAEAIEVVKIEMIDADGRKHTFEGDGFYRTQFTNDGAKPPKKKVEWQTVTAHMKLKETGT